MTGGREKWPFCEVWTAKIPQTVKIFIYLMLSGSILTRDVLRERFIECPLECALCQHQLETGYHLIFQCQYAKMVWQYIARKIGFNLVQLEEDVCSTWDASWRRLKRKGDTNFKILSLWLISGCWHIWLQRNNKIFRDAILPPEIAAYRALDLGRVWLANIGK